ncbi:MAG: glycerol-3-phosphate dehydrogenase [Pseudomonadota bacterium]
MSGKKIKDEGGQPHFDILIIGGGINGAGIAREAAMKGYSVCLCDAGDFGGGTSSASTKLIHGGLRYLEHYEFMLVRKALIEREVLWQMAPHIIWPMRFVLPHHSGLRPAWLLRLGLFLYDYLGGRKLLPPTRTLTLRTDEAGKALKSRFRKAFEYSDCWVEDSRLVILNLRSAQEMGADIRPRTPVRRAEYKDQQWTVELDNGERITASLILNATGPWVDEVLRGVFGINDAQNVRLVRGSHIVVRKKFEHDRAYIFQNADDRIIFAIPYETNFTLIGTTDAEQQDLSKKPEISTEEIDYLCEMASEYFEEPVKREDVVWTYSGVRPLYDDGASKAQEATRDYVLQAESSVGDYSLINIFGGKITTFRKLANDLLSDIESRLGKRSTATDTAKHFPGGDFPVLGFEDLVKEYERQFAFLDHAVIRRLARLYGTETSKILGESKKSEDLGKDFGAGFFEAEAKYLMENEWATESDDILFRRTKLGIHMTESQIANFRKWMKTVQKGASISRKRKQPISDDV